LHNSIEAIQKKNIYHQVVFLGHSADQDFSFMNLLISNNRNIN